MNKHTPGPWKFYFNEYDPKLVQVWSEYDGLRTRHVAFVGNRDSIASSPEVQANARLIAAAPEMLEALKDLVAVIARIPATQKSIGLQELCLRGHAAIAKAEGREL